MPELTHSKRLTPARLRAAREKLNLTQAELGAALGISKQEIYRKESKGRPITRVQALALECLLRRENLWTNDWPPDP